RELLPLLAAACAVLDRHLVDADAAAEEPRGDLGLDREAAPAQVERPEELRAERLLSRHQVGDLGVVEEVGGERHGATAEDVPEAERRVRPEGPRPEPGLSAAASQRLYERRNVRRRVLEVCVE